MLSVDVLSIRKYLIDHGTGSTSPSPYLQVCLLLLDGICLHAFPFDREEYSQFRARIQALSGALAEPGAEPLLGIAGDAVAAMKDYNREAQQVVCGQTVELRCMIEMLSQTLLSLADAGGRSVLTLQTLKNQVENASRLDDIKAVRARLGESLKVLSEETRRQRERNVQMQQEALQAARIASGHQPPAALTDPTTGVSSRERGEAEIAAHLDETPPFYAAVMVLERVENINLRYGFAAGDKLLQTFALQLAAKLKPPDSVFRWRGPAFVALLQRAQKLDAVQSEVRTLAAKQTIEVEGLPLRIPISCASAVLMLDKPASAAEIHRQIDRFIAEHGVSTPKERN